MLDTLSGLYRFDSGVCTLHHLPAYQINMLYTPQGSVIIVTLKSGWGPVLPCFATLTTSSYIHRAMAIVPASLLLPLVANTKGLTTSWDSSAASGFWKPQPTEQGGNINIFAQYCTILHNYP